MPQIRYQPVPIEASHECPCAQSKHKSSLDLKSFSIGTILGIVASCITFALVLYTENRPDRCTRKLSAWSPALSIYSDADFYTTYFDSSAKDPKLLGNKVLPVNEFRGPPSSAIDDAWDKVINPNESLIRLSKDELERSHGPEYAAEYTQELGGGYIATVEIYHYLHCLNMIRKATYMDHYLPRMQEWQDNPLLTRYHIDHCIDNIRQKFMCNPDLSIIPYFWVKGYKQPFPDFNVHHKCRNYSKLLDWTHENSVHGRSVVDLTRPPGAIERNISVLA